MDERGVLLPCGHCGARNRWPFESLAKRIRCGQCKTELLPVSAPVEIASNEQYQALSSRSPLPILIDFWAAWCGPCKMLAPELEKVAAASAGRLVLAKLNTEEVPEIAGKFQIASIPTLVLLKNGQEINRLGGARPASEILKFLDQSAR